MGTLEYKQFVTSKLSMYYNAKQRGRVSDCQMILFITRNQEQGSAVMVEW